MKTFSPPNIKNSLLKQRSPNVNLESSHNLTITNLQTTSRLNNARRCVPTNLSACSMRLRKVAFPFNREEILNLSKTLQYLITTANNDVEQEHKKLLLM